MLKIIRSFNQFFKKLSFAVVTSVNRIGFEMLYLELFRIDGEMPCAHRFSDTDRLLVFRRRIRLRARGNGEYIPASERVDRYFKQERAVEPAGVGDHDPPQFP